ncbi:MULTISPECIES: hypothetical protein [unclassified Pseudomonas]|uniref:hypothetical protein n=1 Tax=unclassified Pseudomonas TaxID=196821 RepID=UPI000C87BF4C|nr:MULTISPECIES: hypothetical protein [unclassified Pseudomonas]PMU87072.1 hypothetical protein C1Y30_23230 [Pseudomonas sp. GW704-F3]PMU91402.1 hypothetical protein C1Y28_23040 [Pseudomonas sp. GW704-F5]PMV01202.1 hypothetical protein C1Y29_20000 [Pseudomonas sp. MPBD4-3]PMV25746.1 hypothetical protein C1Y27_23625 [Pseudomonas sp. GW704-F2]
MSNKIWYLPGPFHQYQEDVKSLAKDAGLRIVDASVTESREDAADNVPDVTVKELPKVLLIGGGSSSIDIDAYRAELESVGLIVESFAEQALARPEGELGPVAGRLFQVFEAVNAGVQSLRSERDGEVEKVKALQLQVDDLLQQAAKTSQADAEAKEIADLKGKLDAAKVTYRANASKESLQKQVDELPKA